jgi:hypothetical protein
VKRFSPPEYNTNNNVKISDKEGKLWQQANQKCDLGQLNADSEKAIFKVAFS